MPQIVRICTSDQSVVWLLILFGYKGFVLLVGLFLAFETRKVKYSSLNESRFIAMSVYGAVIVSITLTPIGFLLENFPNVQYGVAGIMVLLTTTVILALLFVPKVTNYLLSIESNITSCYRCTRFITREKFMRIATLMHRPVLTYLRIDTRRQ